VIQRRPLLQTAGWLALLSPLHATALPLRQLNFPRDFGAHADHNIEWWYITGYATADDAKQTASPVPEFGFQITFFRSRVPNTQGMRSQFAAKQIIFAHAALTDVQGGRLHHDERSARTGFGIAQASEATTDVKLRDWTLQYSEKSNMYEAQISANEFALQLNFHQVQPLLLQGTQGLSRKGPQASQASYYYSKPHLQTSGRIALKNKNFNVRGTAWLDHEWSQALLHPDAVGWDWVGINLQDGSALTAFQLRRKDGTVLWTGGSLRSAPAQGLQTRIFNHGEVHFEALRRWQSASTRATYPVQWRISLPTFDVNQLLDQVLVVKAVIDNQELDSRRSTGAVYWEGLSLCTNTRGELVGRGYLEMTGYAAPLQLG
jgi:predicted secreted hydrolase